ncbi:uncharacterized protein ACRADG_012140 isoform 1-T1 [Cochliomyia hominivorax]
MSFCKLSTVGLFIGGLNVVIYIILDIIAIKYLIQTEGKNNVVEIIILIIVCFIMMILSVFLVKGIKERRHTFMFPWITVSSFFYILYGIRLMCALMFIQIGTDPVSRVAMVVFMCLLIIVAPALTFWVIFNLYDEIRKERFEAIENPG